jgi:hypothetical protein
MEGCKTKFDCQLLRVSHSIQICIKADGAHCVKNECSSRKQFVSLSGLKRVNSKQIAIAQLSYQEKELCNHLLL